MFTDLMASGSGGIDINSIISPLTSLTSHKYSSQTLDMGVGIAYFNCNSQNNYSWYIYTTTPVDLTNYSKIILKGKLNVPCSGGNFEKGIILGLTNSTPSVSNLSDYENKVTINDVGDFSLELDVSNINTSKYVKICCATFVNQGYIYGAPMLIKK